VLVCSQKSKKEEDVHLQFGWAWYPHTKLHVTPQRNVIFIFTTLTFSNLTAKGQLKEFFSLIFSDSLLHLLKRKQKLARLEWGIPD
jgi:hypothetical protein